MNKLTYIIAVLVFLGVVIGNTCFFILTPGRQAIITEFGKPVGKPITEAGLHTKKPFVQEVRLVDKRILTWDGYPTEIPTKDKKYIKVDTTARWKVTNALRFIQTVRNEVGARARLDAILDATTRDVISSNNLVEAVRNSNNIFDKIQEAKNELDRAKKSGGSTVEEEISGEIEPISVGREQLSRAIVQEAEKELKKFGIELIDVQLRRISYEKSVEQKVYERMISERQRIAQKIRSIGQGEKAKIEGRIQKDLKVIESEAYRKAQTIKGKAEAKATAIYAKEFNKGSGFYQFKRSLEAYENALSRGTTKLILSSDSEFLKFLKSMGK
ncbi:MAG: HflC protein [Halobacteriovoraceae bacterium]|nr:HflC protein [Halobacteriovoraceae bacterium]